LIIGPEGTPYENGCFCFDIFIPMEYPEKPPKVQFRTTGNGRVRFNPNLYKNGKVCLSLLGTWAGPGWDAKHSTILQVLLSIQSLILVEQPYFNEPGFETRPHAKLACDAYNQALRYHTMEIAMLDCLRNPDPDMNAVIRMHLRGKKAHILRQCKQWAAAKTPAHANYGLHELTNKTSNDLTRLVAELETELGNMNVESVTIE